MNKSLSILALILWIIAIFYTYSSQLSDVFIGCDGSSVAQLCSNFYIYFYSIYALAGLVFSAAIYLTKHWQRPLIILTSFCAMTYWAQIFTLEEISDFRTYSYEIFIISIYTWAALIATLMLTSLSYPNKYWAISKFTAIFAFIMIVVFSYFGRGSLEHLTPLIGGLYKEHTMEAAKFGKLIYLVPALATFCIAFIILRVVYDLISIGKFLQFSVLRYLIIGIIFISLSISSLISIPFGIWMNQQDIDKTKSYVMELIKKVDQYEQENQEYPKHILQIISENEQPPRLLQRYDYLAENTKGGYFLSRADKYCFLFQDPGRKFGYYSITNERQWRFSHEGKSLSNEYLSICDESENMTTSEGLIAGQLGLPYADDPITQMALELEGEVRKPALSLTATELLQQRFNELGAQDPSIYGEQEDNGELVNNTLDLKAIILHGELDSP